MKGLALAVGLLLPLACAADFDTGLAAYGRGDYAGALAAWRPLAEDGHLQARFYLGVMYLRGEGVVRDAGRAREWFDFAGAAARGDAAPQPARAIAGTVPASTGGPAIHVGTIAPLAGIFGLDDAVRAFGDDYRREPLEDGRSRYTWSYVGTTLVPESLPVASSSVAIGSRTGVRVEAGECRLSLVTGADGGLVEAGARGNACASVLDQPEVWREHHPLYLTRQPAPAGAPPAPR